MLEFCDSSFNYQPLTLTLHLPGFCIWVTLLNHGGLDRLVLSGQRSSNEGESRKYVPYICVFAKTLVV